MPDKAEDESYTMPEALADAAKMLADQFGEADQRATVALATFLYGAHERERFMKQRERADHREFM